MYSLTNIRSSHSFDSYISNTRPIIIFKMIILSIFIVTVVSMLFITKNHYDTINDKNGTYTSMTYDINTGIIESSTIIISGDDMMISQEVALPKVVPMSNISNNDIIMSNKSEVIDIMKSTIPINISNIDITKPSGLSINQFNEIINTYLKDVGIENSLLYDSGEALYNMEKEYGVNGLFCLAVASLESGHGTSNGAINKNNLFGIMQQGEFLLRSFDNIDQCIDYWGNLIAKYYIDMGLTTPYMIQDKYCPGGTEWGSIVNDIMYDYASYI